MSTYSWGVRARKPSNRPTRPGCWFQLAARLSVWGCSLSKFTSPVASTINLKPAGVPRPEIGGARGLEQVVLRCLAKAPTDRYPDAETLGQALADSAAANEGDGRRAATSWQEAGFEGDATTGI